MYSCIYIHLKNNLFVLIVHEIGIFSYNITLMIIIVMCTFQIDIFISCIQHCLLSITWIIKSRHLIVIIYEIEIIDINLRPSPSWCKPLPYSTVIITVFFHHEYLIILIDDVWILAIGNWPIDVIYLRFGWWQNMNYLVVNQKADLKLAR